MADKTVDSKVLLPFVAWLAGVIIITYLLLLFYTPLFSIPPSPSILATYIVIVLLGFYFVWKGHEIKKRIGRRIARKGRKVDDEKAGPVLRKRKRRR
jgi:predicted PurR-regulated permease PerM